VAEVKSILAEGGVLGDVYGVFVCGDGGVGSSGNRDVSSDDSGNIHMDEDTATNSTSTDITCDIINNTLFHLVTTNTTVSTTTNPSSTTSNPTTTTNTNTSTSTTTSTTSINSTNKSSPYGMTVHNTRSTLIHNTRDQAIKVLVVQAGVEMVRKLFYEAQVRTILNTILSLINAHVERSCSPIMCFKRSCHFILILILIFILIFYPHFYAQVLYLENIYQTAEVKYCAVILLINSIKPTLHTLIGETSCCVVDSGSVGVGIGSGGSGSGGGGGVMKWSDVLSHLDTVLSTCYVNIGCSMVHHSVRLRMIGTSSSSTSTSNTTNTTNTTTTTNTNATNSTTTSTTNTTNTNNNTALSVNDLVGSALHSTLCTPLHYIEAGLRVCDTISGRFRKLYALEKMHR